MADEATTETAAPAEAADATDYSAPEFDYSLDADSGEEAGESGPVEEADDGGEEASSDDGETSSTPRTGGGDDATPTRVAEPPPPSLPREVSDRLTAAERRANELEAKLYQAIQHIPVRAAADDRPPKPKDQLQTAADVAEYTEWLLRHREGQIRAQAALDAQAAASEQRARGVLSPAALGEGQDYDAVIARHVEPLERENTELRRLFGQMKDPALARYTFGFIRELSEQFGGDPVKTFNEIRKAMQARTQGAEDMVKKIDKAAKSGADKIRARVGRPGKTPGGKIGPNEITNMSSKQYKEMYKRVYGVSHAG
jgi:hypothetical protein